MEIRQEIMSFAREMERIMAAHDEKKGDSWKNPDKVTDEYLRGKFLEEVAETLLPGASRCEFADVANICMMMWNRTRYTVTPKMPVYAEIKHLADCPLCQNAVFSHTVAKIRENEKNEKQPNHP